MKYPPVQSRTVVVTGCSSGIGEAAARLLRDAGWTVIPTARKQDDLDRLQAEGFKPFRLEIADSQSVRNAVTQILDACGGKPGAVVNNAGYGQPGAIEDLSREVIARQFDVNVIGMQEFTNLFIPVFRGLGYGRIVNISSVLGRVVVPYNGIYSASKYAMEAISDALRTELFESGIAVSLVEPGPIYTEFRKNAVEVAERTLDMDSETHGKLYKRELMRRKKNPQARRAGALPPEAVAKKILHALESPRPRARYRVTRAAHIGELVHRFGPDALVDRVRFRYARKKFRRVEGPTSSPAS